MQFLHAGKAFIFPLNSTALCFDPDLAFLIFQLPLTMKCCVQALMERYTPELPHYNVFPILSLAPVQKSGFRCVEGIVAAVFLGGLKSSRQKYSKTKTKM